MTEKVSAEQALSDADALESMASDGVWPHRASAPAKRLRTFIAQAAAAPPLPGERDKMMSEEGAADAVNRYRSRSGWAFARMGDGSVEIRTRQTVYDVAVLSADEWDMMFAMVPSLLPSDEALASALSRSMPETADRELAAHEFIDSSSASNAGPLRRYCVKCGMWEDAARKLDAEHPPAACVGDLGADIEAAWSRVVGRAVEAGYTNEGGLAQHERDLATLRRAMVITRVQTLRERGTAKVEGAR